MKNVIIITLDALRRDRLNLCNNLKEFEKKSFFFSNMITNSPYTMASFHTLHTGMHPSKNGVNGYYRMFRFKKNICKTLSQYLKEKNYYCVSDVVNKCLLPEQGFDEVMVHKKNIDMFLRQKELIKELIKKEPFFLHIQYSPIHNRLVKEVAEKYDDFSEEYFGNIKKNIQRYEGFVKECNEYVGKMNRLFEELKLFDNSIIIYHSDHGTSVGEKVGEKIYGVFTYDYTVKSFCYLYAPNIKTSKTRVQCRIIDIMPTILRMLNIPEDFSFITMQGKSLIPIIKEKEKKDRVAFIETGGIKGPWPSPEEHNVFCVRHDDKKLICNKTPSTWEFYDLEKDPEEKNNIYAKNDSIIKKYKEELKEIMFENKNYGL
ncbi:MAG: sulfatase-like hydrolase/transferase [Candidatus Woesearchaeota archaeon]|nr:MAG: sulfatase-like hydrolase/transferase [Candidatus Woesearchaeota archaeon]